jgi:hypothetical protein
MTDEKYPGKEGPERDGVGYADYDSAERSERTEHDRMCRQCEICHSFFLSRLL